jgi:VCBS repeat-containing protein
LLANGNYSYTLANSAKVQKLALGQTVTDSFSYTATDGTANSSAQLTITITGENDGPVAVVDTTAVSEDGVLQTIGNVLGNDSDLDTGDSLKIANPATYQGQYGSLVLKADGSYTYSLNNGSAAVQSLGQGEQATDTFSYTVSDVHATGALTAQASLVITVTGTNDGPVAVADTGEVVEDTLVRITGNTLGNDSDVDANNTLSVTNAGSYQGLYGQLVLKADGAYEYLLDNTSTVVQSLAQGQRTSDVFTVTTTDGITTASTSLTIGITGTNDGPVASDDSAAVREDSQPSVTGSVLSNDSDRDAGAVLSVTTAGSFTGQYGTLQLLANGNYSYTLANSAKVQKLALGQTVTDSFSYTATDGTANSSAQLTITITGENDGPVAVVDTTAVSEDGVLQTIGNVLGNDSDLDTGDSLKIANPATYQGQYGSLVLKADGSYTYSLNNGSAAVQSLGQGEQATDTFSYTVSDVHATGALTAQASLVITVTGTNDGPVLKLPIADLNVRAKTVFTLDLPDVTFTDIDHNDVLGYSVTLSNGQPIPTWLSFNANGLVFTGTPPKELSGQSIELRLTAIDRFGASANDVFKIAITSCVGLTLIGGCNNDRLVGTACDDSLDGRQGADTMVGGDGDDVYYVDSSPNGYSAGDVVTEYLNQGYDKVNASVSYTLAQNVEALQLIGCENLTGNGNNLDNWIVGNTGANTLDGKEGNDLITAGSGDDCLYGGIGNDTLEGQDGNDTLDGGDGVDALFGGAGNDSLRSGTGKGLLAGGKGSDSLYAANAATVVAFNKGDGTDILYTQGNAQITLSLGGGIKYEDIKLRRNANDLYFDLNSLRTDSIKVANYYGLSTNQRPTFALQMLTEPSGAYAPNGVDALRDNKIEQFNGNRLIADFNAAYQASASLRSGNPWAVMNSLLSAHLGGSSTAGLGGDLAYQYGRNAGLAGMDMLAANNALAEPNFGATYQNLNANPQAALGVPRLAG